MDLDAASTDLAAFEGHGGTPAEALHLADASSPARRSLLRFLTCGSVDDGKSTLIGRLLYDAGAVPSDHLAALARDSRRFGTVPGQLDFALLLDGLAAEREQGITIDVAHRYFSTPRRAFIVADTPGHEQYTRNMATGASTAELAVILLDAQAGILPQTRRHSCIVSMLGVRHVVLAVNKMDLVGFDHGRFEALAAEYRALAASLGIASVVCVPLCARDGDNVARQSARMPWYRGPTLLRHLEAVEAGEPARAAAAFRMPVQWVNRPDHSFRGYAGTVSAGTIRPGDAVVVLPGGARSTVGRIVTADGDLPEVGPEMAITLTLADERDVSRGDVIAAAGDAEVGPRRHIQARLLWMADAPLLPGGEYLLQLGTATAAARVDALHHAIDIHDFAPRPREQLLTNEIGLVDLSLDRPVAAARYDADRGLGGFILIHRLSNQTAAIGFVQDFPPEAEDEAVEEAVPASVGAAPAEGGRAAADLHWRSLAKAISWRAPGSIGTFAFTWMLTGRPEIATGIAAIEVMTKIGLYYLHERAWDWISWGKRRTRPVGHGL
jgi:bifunctional enzyme CysN/CysC